MAAYIPDIAVKSLISTTLKNKLTEFLRHSLVTVRWKPIELTGNPWELCSIENRDWAISSQAPVKRRRFNDYSVMEVHHEVEVVGTPSAGWWCSLFHYASNGGCQSTPGEVLNSLDKKKESIVDAILYAAHEDRQSQDRREWCHHRLEYLSRGWI